MQDTIETVITTARAVQLSRRESVGGAFEADLCWPCFEQRTSASSPF